jgi:hypothetical protein
MTAEPRVQSGGAADNYTPDTEEVRELYWAVSGLPRRDPKAWEEFDRWLRKVKADTLREAAEEARYQLGTEASGHTSTYPVRKWLNERANQIQG